MKNVRQNIRRLQTKLKNTVPKRDSQPEMQSIRNRISRRRNKVETFTHHMFQTSVHPELVSDCTGTPSTAEKHKMHEWVLTLKYILGGYMISTGAGDISKLISIMGISGDRSFDRQFYRSGKFVHQKMLRRCRKIVYNSLLDEISLTIKDKHENVLEKQELDNILTMVSNDKLNDLPESIQTTPISVSYDMGWNKRGVGRVYDSLSGHAFHIDDKHSLSLTLRIICIIDMLYNRYMNLTTLSKRTDVKSQKSRYHKYFLFKNVFVYCRNPTPCCE